MKVFGQTKHEIDFGSMGLGLDQIVVLSVAGSHLYGTNTEDSDYDYIGVYLPTKRQLLLNDYPKQVSLPKSSGLDLQIWSIHYFLKLACAGETLSIDLLHATTEENLIVYDPDIWGYIRDNRHRFYTSQMKSFVSYARKQAARYGIKGNRMENIESVIKFCVQKDLELHSILPLKTTLKDVWDDLPKGEHIKFLENPDLPLRLYQVCGQKFQETVKLSYMNHHLQKKLAEYGERAKTAKENKGIDWKAISHALRATYQVRDILMYGDYVYPLRDAEFIRDVKLGKHDFLSVVQPNLDVSMSILEKLMSKSDLPEKSDKEYWNEWLMFVMENNVLYEENS